MIKDNIAENERKCCDFSLILMDCMMPLMDGYQATPVIRQLLHDFNLDQPIIAACSGHTEPEYTEKALNAGMNICIFKPCDAHEVDKVLVGLKFPKQRREENRLCSFLQHPIDENQIEADLYYPTLSD
jgi:CheY-like chemotaxis protein